MFIKSYSQTIDHFNDIIANVTDEYVAEYENLSAILFSQENILSQFYENSLNEIENVRKVELEKVDLTYNTALSELKAYVKKYNEQFKIYDTLLSYSSPKNREIIKEEELENNRNLHYILNTINTCDELLVMLKKMNDILMNVDQKKYSDIIRSSLSDYDYYYSDILIDRRLKQCKNADITFKNGLFFKILSQHFGYDGHSFEIQMRECFDVVGIEIKLKFINKYNCIDSKIYHIFTQYARTTVLDCIILLFLIQMVTDVLAVTLYQTVII